MAGSGPSRLLIHASGSTWRWAELGAGAQIIREGRCDPSGPDWPRGLPVHVACDAGLCTALELDLPEMSSARQRQALRWAAEEHLAGPAEDEHVVDAGRDAGGRVRCLVIAHARMEALLAPLAGEAVESVCPDALLLPWEAGEVSLAGLDEQVLARWGSWSFGRFEAGLVNTLIEPLVDGQWRWKAGVVPEAMEADFGGATHSSLMSVLAQGLDDAPVNLLSGPWAPASTRSAGRQWRWVAGLAAAVVVAALAGLVLENRLLAARSADLQAGIEARFAEAFPGIRPAGRHRELAERELARLRFGQSAGLMDLMYRVSPVLQGQPGIFLQGLSYRDERLELDVRAPDVAALDELEQRLRELGLTAAVQSASLDDEGAAGRVSVEGAGS
jgi:general secretion pathway protein L